MLDHVSQNGCAKCRTANRQDGSRVAGAAAWKLAAIVLMGTGILVAGISAADDNKVPEPALVYRRVFVPADNLTAWPSGDEKFLPVETHDLETWIAEANQPAGAARIVDAEYQARLDGKQLVDGRALWKIELTDQLPAFLPLDGTSIVISAAHWRGDAGQPARLGWWARGAGRPPIRGLQVKRSGELELAWHTPKADPARDDLDFALKLPSAVTSRLTLDLPETMVPTLDGGIALDSQEWPANVSVPAAGVLELPELTTKCRRWKWVVGPLNMHHLHVAAKAGSRPTNSPTATVRKDVHYRVTNKGLEIEVRLRLDSGDGELQQLSLSLAAGAKIISVAANDQETPWRLIDTLVGSATQVAIPLSKQPSSGETSIVLVAWDQSSFGKPWPMPTVQVENAVWSSGKIDLELDEDFKLTALTPTGCTQTNVTQNDSPNGHTTTLEFQSYLPNANVDVQIDRREPTVRAKMGTSLQVGGQTVSGRLATRLKVERGSLPSMSAALGPGWTIVAVESSPPEALGTWYVDAGDGADQLDVELNRAASSSNPVSIAVTAERRNTEPLDSLNRSFLELLHWQGILVDRNLLELQTSGRYALKPTTTFSTLPIDEMSGDDRELFAAPLEGRMIDLNASPADAVIGIMPTTGVYDADIGIDASLCGEKLQQAYHVVCRPLGGGVDQLMVYFSEPLEAAPKWEDAETHELILAKRQPENDPRLAGLPLGGELWSLRLGRLYERPISLAMTISTPLNERRQISLLSLPDAGSQRGRVTVRTKNSVAPAIAVQTMSAAPLPEKTREHSPEDGWSQICEIFHYEPVQFYQASATPRLWLGPAQESSNEQKVIARRMDVESFFAADGSGAHRLVYQLENCVASNIGWKLPNGARLETLNLNGRTISPASIATAKGAYQLPLSNSFEGGLLTMELRTTSVPPLQRRLMAAPLPDSNVTVLAGEWSIWLPAAFAATGESVDPNLNEFDWPRRLLAPLNWFGRPGIVRSMRTPNNAGSQTVHHGPSANDTTNPTFPLDSATIDTTGWRCFRTTFSVTPPEPIPVIDIVWIAALSQWILLLAILATSLFKIPAKLLILLISAAATLALLLPAAMSPLADGVLWGLLFGPALRWAYSRAARNPASIDHRQIIHQPRVELAALAIIAALVCMQTDVVGQQKTADVPANDTPAIHRVLVPADSHGQPVGTKQFVDEGFLRDLLKEAAGSQSDSGRCLLMNLKCSGVLHRQSDRRMAETGNWRITLDVETFARDTWLDLPLDQSQAVWAAVASLDGISTPIVWNANGIGCKIKAFESGQHQLAIELEPSNHESNGMRRVELGLPRIRGAAFHMTYPTATLAVTVTGGQFDEHVGVEGTEVSGELDGSGRLTIDWSEHSGAGNTSAAAVIDELSWLRIQRDDVELQVKYMLPGEVSLELLTVVADRRWQLIRDETENPGPEIETLPNEEQSIHIAVPARSDDSRIVTLSFHLRDGLSPGQLHVPRFKLMSLPVANRRMAVSIDPTWDCEPANGAEITGGTTVSTEFGTAWGILGAGPPQFVLNLTECRPGWSLGVRPHVVESKSDERLLIAAAMDHLQLQYEANVQPQGVHRFGWSLTVPDALSIDSVSMEHDGQLETIDYARAAPNHLNIFFARAVDNPYHLILSGRVAITASGECPLPRIAASDPPAVRQIVRILCQAAVTVTPQNLEALEPFVEDVTQASENGGQQLVGTYIVNPAALNDARLLIGPASTDVRESTSEAKALLDPSRIRHEDDSPPSIRLAETTMRVAATGSWFITTRMMIAPHGLTQCVLRLPDDERLVEVKLDGHAALIQQLDDRRWRLQLGPPTLPQAIQIVSRGVRCSDPTARFVTLTRPILSNGDKAIPVEVSLWSFIGKERAGSPRATGAALVSPLEGAVLRLDRLTSILESATPAAMDAFAEDTLNWFVPRSNELFSAQSTVQTLSAQESDASDAPARVRAEDDPASLAVARSAKWIAGLEGMAAAQKMGRHVPVNWNSDLPDELTKGDLCLRCTTINFASEGGENQLKVEWVPVGMTAGESRAILLAGIVSVTGISFWLVGRKGTAG